MQNDHFEDDLAFVCGIYVKNIINQLLFEILHHCCVFQKTSKECVQV